MSSEYTKSVPVTCRIPARIVLLIDELVERGIYPSRSEFIRDAIRRLLSYYYRRSEAKENPEPPTLHDVLQS